MTPQTPTRQRPCSSRGGGRAEERELRVVVVAGELFIAGVEAVLAPGGDGNSQLKLYKEKINLSRGDVPQLPEGLVLPGLQ